jgi:hypothetical protein
VSQTIIRPIIVCAVTGYGSFRPMLYPCQDTILSEISGSHGYEYEDGDKSPWRRRQQTLPKSLYLHTAIATAVHLSIPQIVRQSEIGLFLFPESTATRSLYSLLCNSDYFLESTSLLPFAQKLEVVTQFGSALSRSHCSFISTAQAQPLCPVHDMNPGRHCVSLVTLSEG